MWRAADRAPEAVSLTALVHTLRACASVLQVGKKGSAEDVAEALVAKAQEVGSTDDVTVVALKLG